MDYKLIFDLQTSDIRLTNYLFVVPGAVILLFGLITFLFRHRLSNPFRAKPMPQRLPFFLILFGALWVQLSALSFYLQYSALSSAIKDGKVNVAEGKVVHFKPSAYLGSKKERFCVSDAEACFSYSDFIFTPGFNQTTAQGSPITNGLPVRITYKDNTIVKLEVGSPNKLLAKKPEGDAPPPEAALSPAAR